MFRFTLQTIREANRATRTNLWYSDWFLGNMVVLKYKLPNRLLKKKKKKKKKKKNHLIGVDLRRNSE